METTYIALGSNLNSPIAQLNQALATLKDLPDTQFQCVSPFYRSTPLGPQDQPDYVNAVACLKTALPPLILLNHLQHIEQAQGRIRLRRWGERTLDLDILLYGNRILKTDRLTLPHYAMKEREFVIIPLFDIAPDLILPCRCTIKELAMNFQFHNMVKLT